MRYRFAFFDAQLVLVRTIKAQQNNSPNGIVDKGQVLKVFLWSIWKVVREVGVDRPVLLWDSSPYHKNTILKDLLKRESDYKGDRWYVTKDDLDKSLNELDELESELAKLLRSADESEPEFIEERKAELTEMLEKLRGRIKDETREVTNYNTRQELKYWIINNLGKFGMTSIIKRGWEADDIAYLVSRLLVDDHQKSLVVTTDGDWDYWINPMVDKYNNYSRKFVTYDDVIKRHQDVVERYPDWDLFEMKKHLDTVYGSHNNLHNTINPDFHSKKLWDILGDLENSVTDRELFDAQLATWDFSKYPDYEFMSNCLLWYLEKGSLANPREFQSEIIQDMKCNIPIDHYKRFLDNVNKELWQYD